MSARKLALLGGKKLGAVQPDQHPSFTDRAIKRAAALLKRGATVGLGKHHSVIREAEDAVARWQGARNCMVVSSGHASLHVALLGLGVGPGDEVITTPYSWGASTSCILHCGATPVFTDVDRETGLMLPDAIGPLVTPRTKAVLVVHIHGQPADMPAIMKVARRHGIAVVEDGSQAHAAVSRGKMVGCYGDAAGFSCMGFKLLGTTEAGYLLTKKKDVYWRAALFSQHMGRSPDPGFPRAYLPYADSLVHSYRLSPIAAVLLTEQIKKVDREIEGRRKNVALLREATRGLESIRIPSCPARDEISYYTLSINFQPEIAGIHRDTAERALVAEGLPVGHYVPSPIPHWERMRSTDYSGPPTPWTAQLARAGVDYRSQSFPGAEFKIERSLDMDWNYIKVSREKMRRIAEIFTKLEENLPALRDWESKENRKRKRSAKVRPSRREVLA